MNNNHSDESDYNIFESKVAGFFESTQLLLKNKLYNCAANRLYFTFVMIGIKNLCKCKNKLNRNQRKLYYRGEKFIKSGICQNPTLIGIIEHKKFTTYMKDAQGARDKADYTNEDVEKDDIKDIIPELEIIIRGEGINL